MFRTFLLSAVALLFSASGFAQSHPANGAEVNESMPNSPWPTYHGGPYRQSSTMLNGPVSQQPDVALSYFEEDAGEALGTSPWHILSETKYTNSETARTLWGVSLKYLYKYEVDGDNFRYIDHFQLNQLPFFIGWNFFSLSDGRVVVPNPNGLRLRGDRYRKCRGRHPSLLIFRDGNTSGSPIECTGKFEFSPRVLKKSCGFRKGIYGTTAVWSNVLYSGEVAIGIRRSEGRGRNKKRENWVAILDNDLTYIEACARVSDGVSTNGTPMMKRSDGSTTYFIATEFELIAMNWNPNTQSLKREASVRTNYRGRTGTTPTIFGEGHNRWIATVDAQCAVKNVFNGSIECDQDTSPSKLVVYQLPLGSAPAIYVELPEFIDTVENSPAAAGNDIVVANYSGYTPEGKKDGIKDRALGVVKISWDPLSGRFVTDWQNAEIQISGIPTISTTANRVYGSGTELDGHTYFYGLRLNSDAEGGGGEVVTRVRVGPSRDTKRGANDRVFDAGTNILINDDGSAIWPGGEVLVRIRDKQ